MPTTAEPGSLPILYSFRRCPYAMRARLAIKASGVQVELREVVLRDKPAELIAASPKATVPVLQLHDGTVIDQSLGIMRWALAQHDPQGWLRHGRQDDKRDDECDQVKALIDTNDGPFKDLLDRYKYAPRHPERSADSWRDEAVESVLNPLDDRLAKHAFLVRDSVSLADIAIAPFIRQFAAVDSAWFETAPLPNLCRWLTTIVDSALFESAMTRYSRWQPGDKAIVL